MTAKKTQDIFKVAHFQVVVTDCPSQGSTFGLYVGHDNLPERRNCLFSGHIEDGMTTQLHRLAAHISTLEAKLNKK